MSLLRPSKRRPPPLTDADYDHEIRLVDHTKAQSPQGHSRSQSDGLQSTATRASDSSSRRHSDVPLYKHTTPLHIREELIRRKFSRYQDRHEVGGSYDGQQGAAGPEAENEAHDDEAHEDETQERGRTASNGTPKSPTNSTGVESVIDILYENQRGGFLCGIPLFSSKALGGLDHAPWTNSAHKPSATDITNAQVPDPSWEWAWKEWHVNHQDGVDDEGWEYSFAFGKKISWHGPQWWNSYVRRRAWTRKRVKKQSGYQANQSHMLTPEYFTIHAAEERTSSRATSIGASAMNRTSYGSLASRDMEVDVAVEEIKDIASLMKVLRFARIDREKMEAVENFTAHCGDDLYYLQEYMHEIMRIFIFQASRRLLLTHLLKIFNDESEEQKKAGDREGLDPAKKRRLEYLEAAVKHADEEVKKLEFWSDVKDMAEKGQTIGAADENRGWDKSWAGLDNSGPRDVISDKKVPGMDNCDHSEGNGTAISKVDKGKGKAKD
jgi:hypothetical protein